MTGSLNLTHRADAAAADRQLVLSTLAEVRAERAHSSDVLHQLMSQNRNGVLFTGRLTIGADGWAERDVRAPYASVYLANLSSADMVVSSSAPGVAPPTGPGSFAVPAGTFALVALSGNAVTVYGVAGSKFNLSTFVELQPPTAGLISLTAVTVPVIGTAADNVDGVLPVATGVQRVAAEGYAINAAGFGWDRVRMGRTGTQLVTTGIAPVVNLAAVTVTGAGVAIAETVCLQSYSMQVTVTGGPATINVNLEGSLDGATWFVLVATTNVAGDLVAVTGKPVNFVRANLTVLTGGAAPTVTARIGAA